MSHKDDDMTGFLRSGAQIVQKSAMVGAGSAGVAAGVTMGNSIIAAGFGAAVSPFAAVPVLAVAGAYGAWKLCDIVIKRLELD